MIRIPRSQLLCPGRAQAWWALEDRLAWSDGARLWVEDDEEVAVLPVGPVVDLVETRRHLLILADGAFAFDGELHPLPPGRHGADLRAVRRRARWVVAGLDLPDGATESVDLWPFRSGHGVLWRSGEWLYRMRRGEAPRAVAKVGKRSRVLVGPDGAFLIGDGQRWTRGGPARGSARPLAAPLLVNDWGVRWSASAVAGVTEEGPRVLPWEGEPVATGLPASADGAALTEQGELREGHRARAWGLVEASVAVHRGVIAGPGGVAWDLDTDRPLFRAPVFRLGATVGTDAGFANVDFDDGSGRWIDRSGAVTATFALPLEDDVQPAGAEGDAAIFVAGEQAWRVRGEEVEEIPPRPPALPEPPPATELPVTAATRWKGRIYAWNDEGLLVAL